MINEYEMDGSDGLKQAQPQAAVQCRVKRRHVGPPAPALLDGKSIKNRQTVDRNNYILNIYRRNVPV